MSLSIMSNTLMDVDHQMSMYSPHCYGSVNACMFVSAARLLPSLNRTNSSLSLSLSLSSQSLSAVC